VAYSVEFGKGCVGTVFNDLLITLVSAAFSGCSLTAGPSNFPLQGISYGRNNTVTGSLVGNVLSLAAEWLSFNPSVSSDSTSLTASWQLQCPVRPVRCCWGWCRQTVLRK
jgi:hypothetical protein